MEKVHLAKDVGIPTVVTYLIAKARYVLGQYLWNTIEGIIRIFLVVGLSVHGGQDMVERHGLVVVYDIVHVGIGLPLPLPNQRVGEVALATTVAPDALSPPVVLHLRGINIVGVHHAVGGIEQGKRLRNCVL